MAIDLNGVVTWLKGWFYDKSEVNTYLNAKANKNLTNANMNVVTDSSGDITTEAKPVIPDISGKIDTAGTGLSKSGTTLNHSNNIQEQTSTVFKKIKYDSEGHITGTANVTGSDLPNHTHNTSDVTDSNYNNYINITPSSNSLSDVLQGIDYAIGDMASIHAIEVVSTLPTASADTMGKLYIISENNKVNVYYTELIGVGQHDWHKMDTDILDELSIDWSEIENNPFSSSTPSSFANASHTHGNITNDGKIGSDANKVLITTTNGVISTRNLDMGVTAGSNNPVMGGGVYTAIQNVDVHVQQAELDISALQTGKANKNHTHSQYVTSIALVPKSSDNTGAIRLYYGDEPANNS